MLKTKSLFGLMIYALVLTVGLGFMTTAYAGGPNGGGTPDGETPAEETICDGLSGAAFGLCNAFCEAQDCDLDFPDLSNSCSQLLDNYQKKTGFPGPPCVCRDVCVDERQACAEEVRSSEEVRARCAERCRYSQNPDRCFFRCIQIAVRATCFPPFRACINDCNEQFCIQYPNDPRCDSNSCDR